LVLAEFRALVHKILAEKDITIKDGEGVPIPRQNVITHFSVLGVALFIEKVCVQLDFKDRDLSPPSRLSLASPI